MELRGSSGTDIHDVTPQALTAVSQSGVRQGLLTVHTPGSTAAVTTIENEPGVLADPRSAIESWQQIVVLDLDNRPRQRRVVIQVLGE